MSFPVATLRPTTRKFQPRLRREELEGKLITNTPYNSAHRIFQTSFADSLSSYAAYRFNRKDKRRRSGGLLEDFVEQTGGMTLVAKYKKDEDEMFMKLTGLISSSYTIGYYPENSEFDGKFRRISLELSPRGKAKAGKVTTKTRNGYRALRLSATDSSEARPER